MATARRKPVVVVVALDFGTTYSGYAFSSVKDYKTSKLNITINQPWNSGENRLASFKTPTSLLLKRNGDFVSYGYKAETAYENKLLDKTADKHEFLYFRQFKMELYTRKAHSNMKLKDIHGIEHSAIDVFTQSIMALRQSCLDTLTNQGYELDEDEIKWCLTVPAIWTDEAKIFMRTSCEKAGIPSYRLVIALEPEVASLYCQVWCAESEKKSALRPHTKCLVVDLGGGTADISGHEILKKGLFKEICKSTGNDCGGTCVDQEFFNVLHSILGADRMDTFKTKYETEYLDLQHSFESAKRIITRNETDKINIPVPVSALDKICGDDGFLKIVQNSEYSERITIESGKMRLFPDFARSLFIKSSESVILKIESVLSQNEAANISVLLLVGGFSESEIVQDKIKETFPKKTVITPKDPTLAVLKGAVLFGHQPDVVTTRITQFAYGRKIKPIFDKKQHEERKRVLVDGEMRCDGVFELLVKSGSSVPIGKNITKPYHTIKKNQEKIRVALYKSCNDDTKYIDDEDCSLVGECFITVPSPCEQKRTVKVEFEFGDTEIFITATDKNAKEVSKETFRLE